MAYFPPSISMILSTSTVYYPVQGYIQVGQWQTPTLIHLESWLKESVNHLTQTTLAFHEGFTKTYVEQDSRLHLSTASPLPWYRATQATENRTSGLWGLRGACGIMDQQSPNGWQSCELVTHPQLMNVWPRVLKPRNPAGLAPLFPRAWGAKRHRGLINICIFFNPIIPTFRQ